LVTRQRMSRRDRVAAILHGGLGDRVPVSMWRHFHGRDRVPEELAAETHKFAVRFTPDIVKLTPTGLYGVEDWGAEIRYFDDPHRAPERACPAFDSPAGWESLRPLDPAAGALGRELEALRLTRSALGSGWPLLMTVFSPLTLGYKLVGPRIVSDLRVAPPAVEAGLSAIAETTAAFALLCLEAGADGLFFASQLASSLFLTVEEYARFGEPFDRAVLDAVADSSWLTVLHLHGTEIFFDLANRYPVHAVSWHDRETKPDLGNAFHLTDRILMAGLDRRLLETGSPAQIEEQIRDAVAATGGRRLILAPSCVIPTGAPERNLEAVRRAVSGEQ